MQCVHVFVYVMALSDVRKINVECLAPAEGQLLVVAYGWHLPLSLPSFRVSAVCCPLVMAFSHYRIRVSFFVILSPISVKFSS